MHSTVVLRGTLDVSTRRLVPALLSVGAVQGATAGGGPAGRATRRAVHDGSWRAGAARGPLDKLVSVGGAGARTRLFAGDLAGGDGIGAVVAHTVDGLDNDGLLTKVQSLLQGCEEVADSAVLAWKLHPHQLAALVVYSGEMLSVSAEEIGGDNAGAGSARLAKCVAVHECLDGVEAVAAVAGVTLEVVDNQLFVVLKVAHDDDGVWDLDGGGHSVGSTKTK
jgi:hypothetical protein